MDMRLIQQLLGSAIPMFANVAILFYVCQRFFAASRQRRKIIAEMREFATIVHRARDNLRYIGDQLINGMDQIRDDVGKELRATDRLTTQSAKLAAVLRRFADLEENVIELVRMERNRESVRIETPVDVTGEIERIVAAAEKRNAEDPRGARDSEKPSESTSRREHARDAAARNPLSKFSACAPRETGGLSGSGAGKTIDGRTRVATTPEVRLLGESNRPLASAPAESKRESWPLR